MRIVIWIIGVVLLGIVAFYGIVIAASESGEVVILSTTNGNGNDLDTRLWVVDYGGAEWVRTGHPGKGWFTRVVANPRVKVLRGGRRTDRQAVPIREQSIVDGVNAVFSSKYGIADKIVALSGDASKRVPVRLDEI
jgi:hypothetical protein